MYKTFSFVFGEHSKDMITKKKSTKILIRSGGKGKKKNEFRIDSRDSRLLPSNMDAR